jgi:radical SAM protein with 4Fe4S-binding SPASM domain
MLHPEFFRYLEIARGMGVTISTNGHFIDRENASKLANSGVRKIIISMDGFTQKSYSKYRIGGNIDTVKSGVRLLSEKVKGVRNPPTIVLQVIVNRYNENERDQLKQFAKSLGIKVRFKSMQILGERDRENLLPVNQKYSRYITDTGVLKLNSRFQNRCFRLWTNPVITWNGLVVPCCFDKSGKYVMGDLNKSKFSEIWREDNYNQFRARLMSNRKGIDICLNCTSGER